MKHADREVAGALRGCGSRSTRGAALRARAGEHPSGHPRRPPDVQPKIIVVGLGPAGEELIAPAAREAIASADAAFLRTARHPSAAAFGGVPSFDVHYEEADTFEEVYQRIVEDLVASAQVLSAGGRSVVYAVPGSPFVGERTVELLRADPRVEVTVFPAMSFLDLAWARLGIDPVVRSVRLVDGTRFAEQAAGDRGPLLVAQCWSDAVLSEMKLAVPEAASGTTVTVLHHLGLPDEVTAEVAWSDLDRAVSPDHLTTVWVPRLEPPVASELVALDELVRLLRQDCPWDRQQTHASLRRHLLEESYEVIDAIETLTRARRGAPAAAVDAATQAVSDEELADEKAAVAHLEEELGDLLFQVYFHARLEAEAGRFTVADVAHALHTKLVARHPHVFGDVEAGDAATVLVNWERLKKAEKGRQSVTDGVPLALPALALAAKLQRKAGAVPGMSFPSVEELVTSVVAGVRDLSGGLAEGSGADGAIEAPANAEVAHRAEELLWALSDLVRRAGVEPEEALRAAALRYRDEVRAAEAGPTSVSDARTG